MNDGQGSPPPSESLGGSRVTVTPHVNGAAVEVAGDPSLSFVVQWVPRRDLDPRGAVPVPGRPNTQDFVGLRDIVVGGHVTPGFWVWDNREHQYWVGHDGSFLPRHAPVKDHDVRPQTAEAWLSYESEGVVSRQTWSVRSDGGVPAIDTAIEVVSHRAETLQGYCQLIANYHPESGAASFISSEGEVRAAPDYAVLLNGEDGGARLGAIDAAWLRDPAVERGMLALPVVISGRLWGGWHHVLLADPRAVWGFVTWKSETFPFRAIDYLIGPPGLSLQTGERIRAAIRHAFLPSPPSADCLRALWRSFIEELE